MWERGKAIRHSLLLGCLVLAGCGGGDPPAELAYGAIREDVPSRIMIVEDDGDNPRRLVGARQGASPVLPTWSPNGNRIAFVRYRPTGGPSAVQVYVVNADGTRERHLGEGTLPRWTRNGRALVVERLGGPGRNSTLHVVSLDGTARRLTEGSTPAISPRGGRVAFLRHTFGNDPQGRCCVFTGSSLYTVGLDGSGVRRVATSSRNTYFAEPSWLPDNSAIAVIERRGELADPLLTVSPRGERRMVVRGVSETYDWSPDGDQIAYTGGGSMYIIRRDGTRVASFEDANAIDIEWSPDGGEVAFSVAEGGPTDRPFVGLYRIDVEERERTRFAFADGSAAYLDWRPQP